MDRLMLWENLGKRTMVSRIGEWLQEQIDRDRVDASVMDDFDEKFWKPLQPQGRNKYMERGYCPWQE